MAALLNRRGAGFAEGVDGLATLMEESLKNSITKYDDVIHEHLFFEREGESIKRS